MRLWCGRWSNAGRYGLGAAPKTAMNHGGEPGRALGSCAAARYSYRAPATVRCRGAGCRRSGDHRLMAGRSLQDRVVIVTGASRRIAIGAAIARRVVADGAAVLLHSWVPHDAEQPWGADLGAPEALVNELRQAGGRVEHISADLADGERGDGQRRLRASRLGHRPTESWRWWRPCARPASSSPQPSECCSSARQPVPSDPCPPRTLSTSRPTEATEARAGSGGRTSRVASMRTGVGPTRRPRRRDPTAQRHQPAHPSASIKAEQRFAEFE